MFLQKLEYQMKMNNINNLFDLAKQSDIPYTTLKGFYTKGTDGIRNKTLKKLAKFFNCPIDYFINDDINKKEKINWDTSSSIDYDNIELIKDNLSKYTYNYLKLDNEDRYIPDIPAETMINNSLSLENILKKLGLLKKGQKITTDDLTKVVNFIEDNRDLFKREINKDNEEKLEKWNLFLKSPLYKNYIKEFKD